MEGMGGVIEENWLQSSFSKSEIEVRWYVSVSEPKDVGFAVVNFEHYSHVGA